MKKIADIEKQNNFKVPENYFEKIEEEIIERFSFDEFENNKTTIFQILRPYIYMAACVLVMVGVIRLGMLAVMPKEKSIEPIATEEFIYIEQDQLITYLFDDDVVFYEFITEMNTSFEDNINSEHIEDYLTQYYIEYELFNE